MICEEVIKYLDECSPSHFAYEWDNVGLLVGRRDREVKRIMVALDASSEVIERAVQNRVDMIVTHHPLIFKGMKRVTPDDFIQRRVFDLIQNDIAYYAMHTNFDVMGMADAVADALEIENRQVLDVSYEDSISIEGCGRYGDLSRTYSLGEYAKTVKQQLKLDNVIVYGELDSLVETVAVLPGSGADFIDQVIKVGADVYVTGDIKYHQAIDALEQGLTLIDAGHYGSEKIFIPYMMSYLERKLPQLEIHAYKREAEIHVI